MDVYPDGLIWLIICRRHPPSLSRNTFPLGYIIYFLLCYPFSPSFTYLPVMTHLDQFGPIVTHLDLSWYVLINLVSIWHPPILDTFLVGFWDCWMLGLGILGLQDEGKSIKNPNYKSHAILYCVGFVIGVCDDSNALLGLVVVKFSETKYISSLSFYKARPLPFSYYYHLRMHCNIQNVIYDRVHGFRLA